MEMAHATIAVTAHNGWVAPCLAGVEVRVFRAPEDGRTGADVEKASEAFPTAG